MDDEEWIDTKYNLIPLLHDPMLSYSRHSREVSLLTSCHGEKRVWKLLAATGQLLDIAKARQV